jgi:hypothetical protein
VCLRLNPLNLRKLKALLDQTVQQHSQAVGEISSDMEGCAMSRKPSSFEERMMRAMGLKDVAQLDELLAQPISHVAADHSEPPDEEYEL